MRGLLRFAWLLLVLLSTSVARGQSAEHDEVEVIEPPPGGVPTQKADLARATKQIIDDTNAFRKEQKRGPTTINKQLTEAASAFAHYMAEKDRYGHTADGRRPFERARQQGYEYCIVLENIAYQFSSRDVETVKLATRFVQGWKDSPGHRRNMLDADVTETGVGIARSQKTGYYYAVQLFGRPKSAAIQFRIANKAGLEVTYRIGDRTFDLGPRYIRTHTECRPSEVTFLSGSEKQEQTKLKPGNGDQLVIMTEGEGYTVKKE